MAPEKRRRLLLVALTLCCLSASAPVPTTSAYASAAAAPTAANFWQPVAFSGDTVSGVSASGTTIGVRVNGHIEVSDNAGRSWHSAAELPVEATPSWRVIQGRPTRMVDGQTRYDSDAPELGSAGMVTAPAALPGFAVAVATDGTVWCRAPDGRWQRGMMLLPVTLFVSTPRITAITSFTTAPESDAVYLGVDGYGVFISTDGGVDWLWADTGLPGNVLSLTTDSALERVYAATANGLWMHQLAALPAPPVYVESGYWARVAAIAAVVLLACALALIAMFHLLAPADEASGTERTNPT